MSDYINLVKLCVGCETIEQLIGRQRKTAEKYPDSLPRHLTRMWPKKEKQLLNGGSIFWVIKRFVQCRQKILDLEETIGGDSIKRCSIVLEKKIIRTSLVAKRPFQGWRYLKKEEAPIDINDHSNNEDNLPPSMAGALADMGVI